MSEYYGYYEAPNDFRNYIQHFGILGMKWGVRRYQNPDGTLTPLGRKRYGTAENFENVQKLKTATRRYGLIGGLSKRKGIKILSKDEIRKANEEYNKNPKNVSPKQPVKQQTKGKRSEETQRLENEVSKSKNGHIPKSKVSSALKDALRQVNKPGYNPVKLTNNDVFIKQTGKDLYMITAETEDGQYLEFEYDANNKRALYPSVNG